jgi:hypothetical protein
VIEYGLFNDEGCMEAGFWSMEAANAAIIDRYDSEDELTAREVCPDHEEQPRDTCDECLPSDDDDDDDDDDDYVGSAV